MNFNMLFNLVLAQRFILAQARKDIVKKEWEYNYQKITLFLELVKGSAIKKTNSTERKEPSERRFST